MHFHHIFICTIDCYSLDKSFCPKVPTGTSSAICMLYHDGQYFGGYFIMSTECYICVSEAIQLAETLPYSFTIPVVSFIYFGSSPSVLLKYRCFPSYSKEQYDMCYVCHASGLLWSGDLHLKFCPHASHTYSGLG